VFNESIHISVGSPIRSNNSIKARFNIVGETKVVSDGRSQMQRVSFLIQPILFQILSNSVFGGI